MTEPPPDKRPRHHVVLAHLRRDLEREACADRSGILATGITLSAVELALDAAAADHDWAGVAASTTTRLRAIGLDDATATAWTNELVRAAGGTTPDRVAARRRRWHR